MEIRIAHNSDQAQWDKYVLGHRHGLSYHRFDWLEAIKAAYSFNVYPLMIIKAGQVVGCLPLVHIHLPLTKGELVSLPYCDIGGILANTYDIAEALINQARVLAGELSISKIWIRSAVSLRKEGRPHSHKVRMVLALPETAEALLAGFKAKLRSQVRNPERNGLTAVMGGVELVNTFYKVFAENMRDLGSPVHSRRWFTEVLSRYGPSARVGLVFMPDGSTAAAGIILRHGRTVSIPWASSLRRLNQYNPNMLLYWTFLAYAIEQGCDLFDFGRSSVGEGTYKFKEQWGAKPQALYWTNLMDIQQEHNQETRQSAGRARFEAVWRRLPLVACNFLGPCVRRFVSL